MTDEPQKTVTAYKLFRTHPKKPGQLFPLFIGKNKPVDQNKWTPAEHIPTKGFAERPGWHAGDHPIAPHLRQKNGPVGQIAKNRVWAQVSMPADKEYQSQADASKTKDIRDKVPEGGHYRFKTNKMQGGGWKIGGSLRVDKVMSDREVYKNLRKSGFDKDQARAETQIGPKKAKIQEAIRRLMEMSGVGGGGVAGIGIDAPGKQGSGEPGVPTKYQAKNKSPVLFPTMMKRSEPQNIISTRHKGQFAGAAVFEVNSKLFHNLTLSKRKGKHWRTYLEEDDCYAEIREWAAKNPKGKIVVRNECTGEMRYIRY